MNRRWFFLGGDESRTARHESFWIALASVLAAFGALLRFANHGVADHTVGWVLIVIAIWIGLAFFFPLWLPRIRDSEVIRERRRKDEIARKEMVEAFTRALRNFKETDGPSND